MIYKLKYHPNVKRSDLPKIDAKNRNRIKRAIEGRLTTHPEIYGKPLQRTLKGYKLFTYLWMSRTSFLFEAGVAWLCGCVWGGSAAIPTISSAKEWV